MENEKKPEDRKIRAIAWVKENDYRSLQARLREVGKPYSVWVRERMDAYLRRHNLK